VINVDVSGFTIDLTGSGALLDVSFSMPRAGTIDSLVGFFGNVLAGEIIPGETQVTIIYRLYSAAFNSNIFSPIASVTLAPRIAGAIDGQIATGITTGIGLVVPAQTRLLLVASSLATAAVATTVNGYMSAGLGII